MKAISLIFVFSIVFIIGCEKENTPPTCEITSPSNGAEYEVGDKITISVEADDEDGSIEVVRFYIDDIGVSSSNIFPYNFEWDTKNATSGNHIIKAVSEDNDGTDASDEININIIGLPTVADAGVDQTFTDRTIFTTLSANAPEAEYESGQWSILSGEGGSFDDTSSPTSAFTGTECTAYTLQWTFTTSFNSSSDNVNITFNQTPTTADAGADQTFTDGTVTATLAANTPEAGHGTGAWTIISGTGGSFDDASSPTSTFTGQLRESYELQWSITTSCDVSSDNLIVSFYNDVAGETITDVEGNSYNTVWIGSQQWMAENLKTTKYNDDTNIPLVTDGIGWSNLTTPGYCWYDNDQATYGDTYGALYNWYTVETGNLCPAGWHVPSDAEWTQLTDYLDGESVADGKLKETGTTHWNSPNTGATNESGFTALPGGYRYGSGGFSGIGRYGVWWSATEGNAGYAWRRSLGYSTSGVGRNDGTKDYGFSVRCLRD